MSQFAESIFLSVAAPALQMPQEKVGADKLPLLVERPMRLRWRRKMNGEDCLENELVNLLLAVDSEMYDSGKKLGVLNVVHNK